MKSGKTICLAAAAAAAFLCPALPAAAGDPGASSAAFLKFSPSPRGSGMGEAYTSVAEDAYAAWWNPAGLGSVEGPQLAATYNASLQDVTNQYVSGVYPLRYGSTLGLNITRLSVTPFQGYDAQGVKTSKVDSSDLAVGAAYGRALLKDEIERPVLNAGAGLKVISERLDSVSARTVALDLGAVYYFRPARYWMSKAPAQEFRAAFSLKNFGPGLKFDKRSSPLPMSATLGGAWVSHPGGSDSLILSLDQTLSNDEKYYAAAGAEYVAFQLVSFRAGFRTGQAIGSGVRVGVGFRLSFMDLDYSMSPYGELGSMHKLGVSMRFGEPAARQPLAGGTRRAAKAKLIAPKEKIEQLDLFAKDFLELARRDLAAVKYVSAEANIKKAFNLEPELRQGEWGGREKRLAAVIAGLKLDAEPSREKLLAGAAEQPRTAVEAVNAYLDGKDLKALLLAEAALGTNLRGDPLFEELLYQISDLVKIHVRRDEIMPREALIKEKLRRAAKGFYIQQFDMAARECEEVAVLDEKSPVAWTRLGSAYFMMGDKDKARKAYLKALELNPNDLVTRRFMEGQGWSTEAGRP
ncbi:MAG: PorV/PorQ family protein [Elusimicrobia bacterium]|nr:PorV/PorQ family protein [Elusimicrobiota bacterium]